ncbi:unnamed protein product [Victoria cruziana]
MACDELYLLLDRHLFMYITETMRRLVQWVPVTNEDANGRSVRTVGAWQPFKLQDTSMVRLTRGIRLAE